MSDPKGLFQPGVKSTQVVTNRGAEKPDFPRLLERLGEDLTFIQTEHPTGGILTLGLKSTRGREPAQRFRLRSPEGAVNFTTRITDAGKILSTFRSFHADGDTGSAFRWQPCKGFHFDHEPGDPKETLALMEKIISQQKQRIRVERRQKTRRIFRGFKIALVWLSVSWCFVGCPLTAFIWDRIDTKAQEEAEEAKAKQKAQELIDYVATHQSSPAQQQEFNERIAERKWKEMEKSLNDSTYQIRITPDK
jgi:hypothetical protein